MPTAEENIYNRLSGVQPFHPFSAELLPEDWSIEPGDVVKIKSDDGEYNVPIYSTGINWTGASVVSLSTTGNQERKPLPELKRKEFEQSRATYGNSRAIKKANEEIENHWQHITQVTDQGMSDAFGIIGVKIGADGKPVKDSNGNYVWDDSGTGGEIWGHLNRTAWTTQIVNHIKDANGKIISLGEVYTDAYGNAIINAINDQRTGTARIKADRIQIQSTSGSGITLDNQGNISINAGEAVSRINNQTGTVQYINAGIIKLNGEVIVGEDSQGNTGLTSVGGVFTHIDVNWIEAANINVEEIDASASVASPYLQGDELYVTQDAQIDGTLTIGENEADVSGAIFDLQIVAPAQGSNTYTLQKKSFSDSAWQDVGTFSRATTLDGAWSSGVYTVTATPQGDTESTQIYLGATGNGSSNFSVNTYHDSIDDANIAISDYIYLTEEVAAKTVSAHWHNAQGTAYGVISTQATYNNGWDDASDKTEPPSDFVDADEEKTSFIFKAPKTTTAQDGKTKIRKQTKFTFRLTKTQPPASTGTANVINSTGKAVGRINIGDWYTAGYDAGIAQHTATAISDIILTSSDKGNNVVKYPYVTYSNGDVSSSIATTIDASAVYEAGWGAAYTDVSWPSARSESETQDTTSMTIGAPSSTVDGTPQSKEYTLSATKWTGNTAFAKVKNGNDEIMRLTLDATPRFNAGSASVGLDSPNWGTAPNPLTNSRTVSVSTTRRVDRNGTAANLTKAIALYLTQGSFDSEHKMTVSLRDTSSSGTVRAETEVDASGLVSAVQQSGSIAINENNPPTYYGSTTPPSIACSVIGTLTNGNSIGGTVLISGGAVQDAYDAGQDSVTIVKGTWGNGSTSGTRKVEFTKSAGTQDTKNVILSAGTETWNGNTATVPILDGGDSTGLSVEVDASGRYTQGMNDVGVYITRNGSWVSSYTVQSGDSETFYPAKWIDGSFEFDTSHGLTVTASGGSSQHDIRITASIRGGNRPVTTEIFADAGAYEDLHNARPGYYTFKVTCGGTEKWYYFRVGNP